MKVSKPVLIFGIVVLLISGYIFFFTGKKKAPIPPAPPPAKAGNAQQTQPGPQGQPTSPVPAPPANLSPPGLPAKAGQSETAGPFAAKPDFDKLKTAWVKNPFILPQFKEEKKKETVPAVRLFAIFERGEDRVAIIDREVVRKGDMVGDEKVFGIEKDTVVLIRNGTKRVLSLTRIEDTAKEEELKTKATEKGK